MFNLTSNSCTKIIKKMDYYIKFEDTAQITLPNIFSDILIYCTERNVMLVDFLKKIKLLQRMSSLLVYCVKMVNGMLWYLKLD